MKSKPFFMSFEEIKGLTFKQVLILIEEWNKDRMERFKQYGEFVKKNGKDAFPIVDIAKGILE